MIPRDVVYVALLFRQREGEEFVALVHNGQVILDCAAVGVPSHVADLLATMLNAHPALLPVLFRHLYERSDPS